MTKQYLCHNMLREIIKFIRVEDLRYFGNASPILYKEIGEAGIKLIESPVYGLIDLSKLDYRVIRLRSGKYDIIFCEAESVKDSSKETYLYKSIFSATRLLDFNSCWMHSCYGQQKIGASCSNCDHFRGNASGEILQIVRRSYGNTQCEQN